jgi:hypothetical protein
VRYLYFKILSTFFKSHSCLLELRYLSTYMFAFHYRLLQCMACYWEWSCQFVLVGSTVRLPYLLDMFLLILAHVYTSVFLSSCTLVFLHILKCSCALYHVLLYAILLQVLGMLI